MPRPRTRVPLNVFLNSRLVGRLERQASGAIAFGYDPRWLGWEHALPVSLSLPLREDRFLGAPVLAVFENLLPDERAIRRRLAERVGAAGDDAFNLLAAVGRDCVGALQFLPEGTDPGPAGKVSGRRLSDAEIAARLRDLSQNPLGVEPDDEFRISLAGAQEKTALLHWRGHWQLPHAATATTHILKPAIGILRNGMDLSQSIENEHFCMRLAAAFGLPVAATAIRSFDGMRALVVERFDRQRTADRRLLRLPQEDCCQALAVPPTRKYEPQGGPGIREILELLKASDDPEADRRQFLKAQIVFWLLGATDGHAKNFSIHLLPGGRFRLAPLYDIMSTQPNVDTGQIPQNRVKFAMAVGKQRHYVMHTILPRHFVESAQQSGLPAEPVTSLFDEIQVSGEHAIEAASDEMPRNFPARLLASITAGVRHRLRLIQAADAIS